MELTDRLSTLPHQDQLRVMARLFQKLSMAFGNLFAMQVGCGIDDESFAFGYAKNFNKKPVISCGVVLNKGTLPMVILK